MRKGPLWVKDHLGPNRLEQSSIVQNWLAGKEHFGQLALFASTLTEKGKKNHGTQDSRVVPHRGTNWAALWLTAQIGRDAVFSESYGRG